MAIITNTFWKPNLLRYFCYFQFSLVSFSLSTLSRMSLLLILSTSPLLSMVDVACLHRGMSSPSSTSLQSSIQLLSMSPRFHLHLHRALPSSTSTPSSTIQLLSTSPSFALIYVFTVIYVFVVIDPIAWCILNYRLNNIDKWFKISSLDKWFWRKRFWFRKKNGVLKKEDEEER